MRTIKVLAIIGLAVALVGVPALAQQQVQTFTFCISGQSNGTGWQYQLIGADANGRDVNTGVRIVPDGTVPSGRPENDFVQFFINALRPDFGAANVQQNAADNKCFDIKALRIGQFLIGVGAQQAPQCNVMTTRGGCAFNPTISLKGLPTITEWGLIALAVLLAGGMGYMIYRRRPALRPAAP